MNKEKWNAACDIMLETIYNVESDNRAEVRGEKCCHELDAIKSVLIKKLNDIRQ